MLSPKILIVEDNWEVRELLKVILKERGYDIQEAETGRQALDACEDRTPDLVVLDLTLPDIDGLEVCKKIRSFPAMESVPIIICSGRTKVSERVTGLETGADDYLIKPFDPAELVARVRVLLRKAGQETKETRGKAQSGEIKLDPKSYTVTAGGAKVEGITPREFDILHLLVQKSPEPLSRAEISKFVLGKEQPGSSRAIDMHIAQIRKKLGQELAPKLITIPGKGYLWSK